MAITTRKLPLSPGLSREWIRDQLRRKKEVYLDHRHFDSVTTGEAVDALKPDGSLLFSFRPGALSAELCNRSRLSLRRAGDYYDDKRGMHTRVIGFNAVKKHGVAQAAATAFTRDELTTWAKLLKPIRRLAEVYRDACPEQYAFQHRAASRANPRWIIPQTPFSTGVVNRWSDIHRGRTALHTDAVDLPGSMVAMTVVNQGEYTGGETIFPEFGVAVDVRCGDALLADPHELHCNNAIHGEPGWERIAVVMYLKSLILECD